MANSTNEKKIYEVLAQNFAAEGVKTHFCLMGDGNMHWATAMNAVPGMEYYHARHEHCAVAMAMGYHSATGEVGVASVTCGPGFTQIMTGLTAAVRCRIPLVIFVGETPISERWHNQRTEQSIFATACGAHYIAAHSPNMLHQYVRDAFFIARFERRPVILAMPFDLQKEIAPHLGPYEPSAMAYPSRAQILAQPQHIREAVDRLLKARCPTIVAGRGVLQAGAVAEVEQLAEKTGALLGTTLLTRGMYDHNPFSLGVVGGFGRDVTREVGLQTDLVLAIGASLTHHTLDGGRMFPNATVVQIDVDPTGLQHGRRVADLYIQSDAKFAVEEMLKLLAGKPASASMARTSSLAERLRNEPADGAQYRIESGTLDPRAFFSKLESILPKDFDMLPGDGHQSYFHTVMRGFDPSKYHSMTGFGAIGSDLAYAIGVTTARKNGKVVLFEGDGSLLMHVQEFEAIRRHNLKLLIVCCNDGAYGSEIHKLRAGGLDDSGAVFGRPDFEAIAKGFGLRGATVTSLDQIEPLMNAYQEGDGAMIWNVHVSDQVLSPTMRKRTSDIGAAKAH